MDLLQHARGASVPLESVLCTEELQRRPSRPPDYQAENRALVALTQALADAPRTILQTLADTILDVLQSDSAGVSLLTPHDGGKTFYWPAIAGAWKPHIGGGTPRDFGPCGDVLDRNIPLLFRHFERRYTYFQPVTPPTEECLLVPFYVAGKAVGTIWAITHHDQRRFDAEDQRQLVSLGRFASAAYQAQASVHATAQLAAIIESSDDAIVSKDLNGIIQTWNRGAEQLFGYPASEAIGQSITLIIPADRLDEEPAVLARIRRGERIDHYETVRRRKDGTCVDISLSVSPITDMRRQIVGASKIARDITERTQATAELERRRLETATLTEIAQRLTTSLDLDMVLQQVVLGAQALCGSARVFLALRDPGTEVLVGRYEVGASQAGYIGRRLAPGEGLGGQVLRTGRPWRTADYGADGRFRPMRSAGDPAGGHLAVLAVPILMRGQVAGVLYASNPVAQPFTDREEAILVRLAVHAAVAIQNAQLYQQAQDELRERRKIEAALAQAAAELQQRVEARTVALHQAIAARQRLEQEAQQATHFAVLGQLAAGVSHEIRNPLGAIFLHVDLLEEELRAPRPDDAEAVPAALAEIKTQLARLDDLVQDYLTLVRVSGIQREVQDLGAAVQGWGRELAALARPRGATVALEGVEDLGRMAFHANTLYRAMLNLVQNALDAMPAGGTITLAGHRTAQGVQLQVRDTGSGVPPEHLGRIFEPLYTTKPGGTGLGLYITQEIVAAHGGQITVESVVGQGTVFTLTFPPQAGAAAGGAEG